MWGVKHNKVTDSSDIIIRGLPIYFREILWAFFFGQYSADYCPKNYVFLKYCPTNLLLSKHKPTACRYTPLYAHHSRRGL